MKVVRCEGCGERVELEDGTGNPATMREPSGRATLYHGGMTHVAHQCADGTWVERGKVARRKKP